MNNTENNEIIIFDDKSGEISIEVSLTNNTVWLNQKQMAILFDVKIPAINKHIKNILNDGELDTSTVSKMEIVQKEGKRDVKRDVEFYNLDMIISLGYRVNSKRATNFRIWATKILKKHIVDGYTVNQKRVQQKGLNELTQTIELLKSTIEKSDLELTETKGLLSAILNYSRTWTLLQGYDEDSLTKKTEEKEEKFILEDEKQS